MPIPETSLVDEFDTWINTLRPEGATVMDGSLLLMSVMIRLRSVLTVKELHAHVHYMVFRTEAALQETDEVENSAGEKIPLVLAEHWRGAENAEELYEFLKHPDVPDAMPEAWLNDDI